MKKKTFLVAVTFSILAFLSMTLFAIPGKASAAESPLELRIGILACLSGWFSGFDTHNANEAQMVAEYINEHGGVKIKGKSYTIKTFVEDGKSTLDGITAATNRLLFDHKVNFVVGPVAYFNTAAAPIMNQNKILNVIGFSTNQPGEMDKTTPYTFLGHNGNVGETLAALKFLKQHYPKVKKLVVVTPDDGAIPYLAPILKRVFAANGFEMVGDPIGYSNETVDYNPLASKINAVKEADAIFHKNGIALSVGGIVKGLRSLGNMKPYASVTQPPLTEIMDIAGARNCADVFALGVTPVDPSNTPQMNEIGKRIVAKYGANTTINYMTANALWILKHVIEAADSTDPSVVKAKWEKMDKVDTLFGPGKVCGDQTYGIKHHAIAYPQPIQMMKNGKAVAAGLFDPGLIP